MRSAEVSMHGGAGRYFRGNGSGKKYRFTYFDKYTGPSIALTMPVDVKEFVFDRFPPFFDGLLPEGPLLEGLLRQCKIDKFHYVSQLIAVGNDLVGAVTVQEKKE